MICFAIVAAMVAVLAAMGRQLWCQCGQATPWAWDIWSEHASQHLIDPYFFTHVLHGVIFYWVLKWMPWPQWLRNHESSRWAVATAIEASWEILENSPLIINRYREATMALGYTGDSIANSIADVIACLTGYFIASKAGWKWSILFAIALEVGLLITIRDSLLLNIIMLGYPIDAIREWQTP
ncbi:hypothetical protein Pla22_17100 [Rubripirellula amarantea]|uniref:Uncharacterized protein n=2 Tax=Rubripirellula amarantea TaxID=2527999 RepID=A0A5C5WVV8_9BACT|nr:hypothetical protein Pla22_17100 [Rubripirellula amarantea]